MDQSSSGIITFNGIGDADLVKMLEIKEKHENSLDYESSRTSPQQMVPGQKLYQNVTFGWRGADGLKAALEIFQALSA
jgi:hypothetical protein